MRSNYKTYFIAISLISFLGTATISLAGNVDIETTLKLVQATDDLCNKKVKYRGGSTSIAADGELSVEMSKYLKKLIAPSGKLSGLIDKKEWDNVPQSELLSTIRQTDGCRERVLALLLQSAEPNSESIKNERRKTLTDEIDKLDSDLQGIYSDYDSAKKLYDANTSVCANGTGLSRVIACDLAQQRRPKIHEFERIINRKKERRTQIERLLSE